MVMTESSRPSVSVARVNIRCTGTYHGAPCGWLLAKPRVDYWETDMASEAELVCKHCGTRYTLAEYK